MIRIQEAVLVLSFLASPLAAHAADKNDKFVIRATDNLRTILEQQIDLPVRLHLKSGNEIGGFVTKIGNGVVQISEVSGLDLYDAVVNIEDISAVLLKVRKLK